MLTGRFSFPLSEALLTECRNVLLRERIQRRHGLSADEIDQLLTAIVTNAILRNPALRSGAPDANDNHLWSLARQANDAILVTGDGALRDSSPAAVRVLSPREFVAQLPPSARR